MSRRDSELLGLLYTDTELRLIENPDHANRGAPRRFKGSAKQDVTVPAQNDSSFAGMEPPRSDMTGSPARQ